MCCTIVINQESIPEESKGIFPTLRGQQGTKLNGRLGELSQELRRHTMGTQDLASEVGKSLTRSPLQNLGRKETFSFRHGSIYFIDLYVESLQVDLETLSTAAALPQALAEF